ncbi:MAG: cytochrome c oxidase subunit II [Anaerolineae bacterium]
MATVPQQNQSSEVYLLPLIVFGVLSLVFGLAMWWFLPVMGVLPPAASIEAERTDGLFRVLMGIGGVVFFLVQGLIYYAAVAFRAKPGDTSDGPNIHGNVMLEIVWTIVPALIVVVLAIYSYTVWVANTEVPENPNEMWTLTSLADEQTNVAINAYGQRYAWSFEYITNDFADVINDDDTITEGAGDRIVINTTDLYIYAGQQVDVNMETLDVIHSFWAPDMRVKQDLLPGRITNVTFTPRLPDSVSGWEYVMLHSPLTVYTEPDFESDALLSVELESEDALPELIELRLADPEANITPDEGTIWVPVLNERGVEGYLPVNPETEIGRFNRYRLICTELCGGGHGDMFTDIVMFENQDALIDVWYIPTIERLSVPAGDPFEVGENVIGAYGCAGCHVLDDLGWMGNQGPTLNGIGARSSDLADASGEATGDSVENGAEYLVQSIRLSQDYLVSGYPAIMPYFHPGTGTGEMPQEDLIGIVAYLCTQTESNPEDSDCGLNNWEFDENGEFVGDVDALVAELTAITEPYED